MLIRKHDVLLVEWARPRGRGCLKALGERTAKSVIAEMNEIRRKARGV